MNDLTRAALQYLADGHHLLALTGKRPNPKYHATWTWDDSIHGQPEDDEDLAALDAIFRDRTTTGVAILIPEHALVADVDTEAAASLLAALGAWPIETRTALTPNGLHLWFVAPGADGSRWVGGRTLLFKGFGGYVAAPPSRHFNGDGEEDGVYTWGDEGGVAYLPDQVRAQMEMAERPGIGQVMAAGEEHRRYVVEMADGHWTGRGWVEWNIDGLLRAIREAPDGNQNNVIHWAACVARDEGVPFEVAMPLLLTAALEGNHPRRRAETTIRGAFTRGKRE